MITNAEPTAAKIEAPYEAVRDLVHSTFDVPARYSAQRLLSRTTGHGPGWLRRKMLWPIGGGRSEVQALSWTETSAGFEVEQRAGSDEVVVGRFRLTRSNDNRSIVTLEDVAKAGTSIFGEPKAQSAAEIAARIAAALRERASAPDWVTEFYAVLDRLDADAFTALMREDCEFQSNAADTLKGTARIRENSLARWTRYNAVSHHLVNVVAQDNAATAIECRTSYQRSSDLSWVTLPAAVFIERDDKLVTSVKVFVDNSLFSVTHPV
jgi:ketosteroid isomerase-like protein